MKHASVTQRLTTPAGLAGLMRFIASSADAGKLDPEFAGKLAKRIAKEYELLVASGQFLEEAVHEVRDAMESLQHATAAGGGKLLSEALIRLRARDGER